MMVATWVRQVVTAIESLLLSEIDVIRAQDYDGRETKQNPVCVAVIVIRTGLLPQDPINLRKWLLISK